MKEEIISFKAANLAKEKKFDWDCDYFYNKNGKLCDIQYYDSTPNNKLEEGWWFSSNEEFFCAAPTQSILQRWLREKHDIILEINYSECEWWQWIIISKNIWIQGTNKTDDVDLTYEQALEAGLYEALQLIK